MSTSSSNSELEVLQGSAPPLRKPQSINCRQPKKFFFKKLALFAALAILILAYVSPVSTVHGKEAEDAADLGQARVDAPAISEKFPLEGDSLPTSMPPPQPKSTPEPAPTAISLVSDTQISTPPPRLSVEPATRHPDLRVRRVAAVGNNPCGHYQC